MARVKKEYTYAPRTRGRFRCNQLKIKIKKPKLFDYLYSKKVKNEEKMKNKTV